MTVSRIILAQQAISNYVFWAISVRIRARFGLISELIFGLKTGPLRGPVLRETQGNAMLFALSGGPEVFHFGIISKLILGPIPDPFFNTILGAGQPGEIPNGPKESFQKQTFNPEGYFE